MSSQTFSSLAEEGKPTHTRKPSASNPIVRPGPNAEGPEGFVERIAEKNASHSPDTSPKSGLKDKVRKVGEKLALVSPRDEAGLSGQRGEAARQDASTMPE